MVRLGLAVVIGRQEHEACVGGGDFGFVFWIAEETQVAGLRLAERGDVADGKGGGAAGGDGLNDVRDLRRGEGNVHIGHESALAGGRGNLFELK